MAVLGHTTLEEAERYTREADRRRGGRQAIIKLDKYEYNENKFTQTARGSLGIAQEDVTRATRFALQQN